MKTSQSADDNGLNFYGHFFGGMIFCEVPEQTETVSDRIRVVLEDLGRKSKQTFRPQTAPQLCPQTPNSFAGEACGSSSLGI